MHRPLLPHLPPARDRSLLVPQRRRALGTFIESLALETIVPVAEAKAYLHFPLTWAPSMGAAVTAKEDLSSYV